MYLFAHSRFEGSELSLCAAFGSPIHESAQPVVAHAMPVMKKPSPNAKGNKVVMKRPAGVSLRSASSSAKSAAPQPEPMDDRMEVEIDASEIFKCQYCYHFIDDTTDWGCGVEYPFQDMADGGYTAEGEKWAICPDCFAAEVRWLSNT